MIYRGNITRRLLADHRVAAEFDLDANAPLTPSDLSWGSKAQVWWRCARVPEHGLWQATVNNRTKPVGSGCPRCHGNRITGNAVPADRSLQGRFPDEAAELNPVKSGFSADQVTYGSKKSAWWTCPQGHEYPMTVNQRTNPRRPQGCPYCAGRRVAPERSLAAVAPEVAVELDAEGSGVTAAELMPNSNRLAWWRCRVDADHRWQATPGNRVSRGSGCPYCSGARVSDSNRLSLNSPDQRLLMEWDYERNFPLTPHDVPAGSSKKVWWVCDEENDHRWEAAIGKRAGGGQGCPFCAGNRVSSTNSLAARRPDIASELDIGASGVTADQISFGSGRPVTWKCAVDDSHVWQATVGNRTGGNGGRGTGCPYCRLVGTSEQELQLKAELAAVLPVDLNRAAVPDSEGKLMQVDVVIADPQLGLRVVVEFDGLWWHNGSENYERDAKKSDRLREAGWKVIRVRERPLPLINPEFDVAVGLLAPANETTAAVLDRMAALDLITAAKAQEYRKESANGLLNVELARNLIREHLGRERAEDQHRSQEDAWNRMYGAVGAFASEHGHCRVPEDAEVAGVNLSRWIYKQCALYRQEALSAERAKRLREIPAWSFESPRLESFWAQHASYLEVVSSATGSMPRSAVIWASNLRTQRAKLLAQQRDVPAYQLNAMESIPGWQWNPAEEGFEAKISILEEYLNDTGKTVGDVHQREKFGEHKIGTWINSWRTRRYTMPEQHRHALEELPAWSWDVQRDQWEEKFQELVDFGVLNGHVRPSMTSENGQENSLALWKRNNKNRLRGKTGEHSGKLRDLLAQFGESLE